jgi:glycosyltransferase involved in cell wall biosynthesis
LAIQVLKISVLIPSYNQAEFLAKTLATVAKQGYEPLEVIIMDGGSTDRTAEVVKAYGGLVTHFCSERDEGQLHAVEKALGMATGDICYWCNADDAVMPGAFEFVARTFARHPEADIVFSDDFVFDETKRGLYVGSTIRFLKFWDHFLFYRQMYSECIFWKRAISTERISYDHSLRTCTDYSFFLPLTSRHRTLWVRKRLGAFRMHPTQMSKRHQEKEEQERELIKQRMRTTLAITPEQFRRLQSRRRLWFLLRHDWYVRFDSALRFLWRKATGDRDRKKMAAHFFNEWLQPPRQVQEALRNQA